MMLSLLLALAQVTPDPPLPKGTGLPPPSAEEAAVMAPIQAALDGVARRDAAAITAQLLPGGSATVAIEQADGRRAVRRLSWSEWAAGVKPGPEQYRETLGTPAIEIDGDVAMVWAPYVFTIDGKPHHCGYDHFDLVRDGGRWRIANVTWSQRTTGCEATP